MPRKKERIVEVDLDDATYIGSEDDGVYFAVGKGRGGWYMSASVDCNSGHFTDTLVLDDGPYKTEKEAVDAGRDAAIEWCVINNVPFEE